MQRFERIFRSSRDQILKIFSKDYGKPVLLKNLDKKTFVLVACPLYCLFIKTLPQPWRSFHDPSRVGLSAREIVRKFRRKSAFYGSNEDDLVVFIRVLIKHND